MIYDNLYKMIGRIRIEYSAFIPALPEYDEHVDYVIKQIEMAIWMEAKMKGLGFNNLIKMDTFDEGDF